MSHLILLTCSSYSLDLKGFPSMTQLNLKRGKGGLAAVFSQRERSCSIEPAETRSPEFQSWLCECQTSAVLRNQWCRWAETISGISFSRSNAPKIPWIFIKCIWPKSLAWAFSASAPLAAGVWEWKMHLPGECVLCQYRWRSSCHLALCLKFNPAGSLKERSLQALFEQ